MKALKAYKQFCKHNSKVTLDTNLPTQIKLHTFTLGKTTTQSIRKFVS